MAYHCTILFPFVSMILRSTQATGHTARSKALTVLLQGLLRLQQASRAFRKSVTSCKRFGACKKFNNPPKG